MERMVKLADVLAIINAGMFDLRSSHDNIALQEAIRSLPTVDAEPDKQERCEFCKNGITFWGADLILDNEGNWHKIRYCPNCGAKMDDVEEEKRPRLIDADRLKQVIADNVYPVQDAFNSRDYGMFWTGGIEKAIDDAPTVDAVEVVRCKDCEWKELCAKTLAYKGAVGYCSTGERKKDEADRRR